jgi:hypothetical protein
MRHVIGQTVLHEGARAVDGDQDNEEQATCANLARMSIAVFAALATVAFHSIRMSRVTAAEI